VHLDDRKVTSTGKLVGCEMAMNRIQFQHGLSMPKFLKGYITEVLCEQALEADRWPKKIFRMRPPITSSGLYAQGEGRLGGRSLGAGKYGVLRWTGVLWSSHLG